MHIRVPSRTTLRLLRRALSLVMAVSLVATLVPVAPALAANEPVTVKIAVAVPLTQGATAIGAGLARGAEAAVAEYNASQRFQNLGIHVELVKKDDKGDPTTAVNVANQIVADTSILGVVGHLNSGCSIPAARIYDTEYIPMVTPFSTNPVLTQLGYDSVFRTCTTDAEQGPAAADRAAKGLLLKRCFVVDDSTPYGETLSVGFAKRYKADGGVFVGSAKTTDKTTDFSAIVAKIKTAKPDVVYYGGIYIAGSALARQLSAAGVTAPVMGGDGLFDSQYVRLQGSAYAEGDYATSIGLPLIWMPGRSAFTARYASVFPGIKAQFGDAYAYDAASAILEAFASIAENAENGNGALTMPGTRQVVRDVVALSDFDGVTGHVSFDANGDTKDKAVTTYRVRAGKWEALGWRGEPVRVAGGDRYLTSIEVSKRSFPTTSAAAVLATGGNFPDALCAAPLAVAYGGPVLLVPPTGLTPALRAELTRLRPKDVIIIGSETILPPSVSEESSAIASAPRVKRVFGEDRFETSAKIALELKAKVGDIDQVEVVTGYAFPDALSIAPVAAAHGRPILLTRPLSMPKTVLDAMVSCEASGTEVIGGEGAIAYHTVPELPGVQTWRIFGHDRYDTNRTIAELSRGSGDMSFEYVALATGANYPDALSAGALVAQRGGVLLLTAPYPTSPTRNTVIARRFDIRRIDVIGGVGPMPDLTLRRLLGLF